MGSEAEDRAVVGRKPPRRGGFGSRGGVVSRGRVVGGTGRCPSGGEFCREVNLPWKKGGIYVGLPRSIFKVHRCRRMLGPPPCSGLWGFRWLARLVNICPRFLVLNPDNVVDGIKSLVVCVRGRVGAGCATKYGHVNVEKKSNKLQVDVG